MAKGNASKRSKQAKQAIVRLQLDIPAKEALDELARRRGMTQSAVSHSVR